MDSENMSSKNFKFFWKFHNDKQEVLSKILGVSQSTISAYANEKMTIPAHILKKIAYRYNVSVDDLLNKDLSSIYDLPLAINIDDLPEITMRTFPLLTSNIAKNNADFNKAHEINLSLFKLDNISELDSKICVYEHAIELYKKAWDESKTYVALANCISLILLISTIYGQRNLELAQMSYDKDDKETIEIKPILRELNKSNIDNKYKDKCEAFIEKYYDVVFENIKLLKRKTEFADLGDFYLSICYLVGFVTGSFDYISCVNAAFMMLFQQFDLDNKYAEKFLEIYDIIENLDN